MPRSFKEYTRLVRDGSHTRHLSQTEVGTVEREDRTSSQSGEGGRWEDSR